MTYFSNISFMNRIFYEFATKKMKASIETFITYGDML